MTENPLGKNSVNPEKYDPGILYPIPRWPSRSLLDLDKKIPLHGFDYWRAYEMSWLDSNRKPVVAIGELFFDAKSENLVESKSFKLYLNSLNNEQFASQTDFADVVSKDLKNATQSEVVIEIHPVTSAETAPLAEAPGQNIDDLQLTAISEEPDSGILKTGSKQVQSVKLFSNLFRSRCPMTGQPDWATFMVDYSGPEIEPSSLLSYVCSFRSHQGYHEECAELMFRDIMLQCQPDELVLGLNYTRRGGLDINPFRSNNPISPENLSFRLVRQ